MLLPDMFEVYGMLVLHGLPHSAKDVADELRLLLMESGGRITIGHRDTIELVVRATMTNPRLS